MNFNNFFQNNTTEEYCENLHLKDKKGKSRKIHTILTSQMENNRYDCINRDKNSCKNMKKIVDHWFENGERPIKYQRGYDISIDDSTKTKNCVNPKELKHLSVK